MIHQSPQEQGGRPGVHPHAAAALLSPSPLTTGALRTWLHSAGRPGPVVTADIEALADVDVLVGILVKDPQDKADQGDAEIVPAWEATRRPGVALWAPLPALLLATGLDADVGEGRAAA